MARIALDARNITQTPAGVARYAMALIPELVAQAPEHEWVVIRHSSNQKPLGLDIKEIFVDREIDGLQNYLHGHKDIAEVTRRVGPLDLYHDLFHILPRKLPTILKTVVTLHDLVWIDHADASQPTWLKARSIEAFAKVAIPSALRRADHVISVSEPTAERAHEWIGRDKITVVMHGVDPAFSLPAPPADEIVNFLQADGRRYIVAVGNSKPYKNLGRLIRAWNQVRKELPGTRLCLIGNCSALGSLAESLNIPPEDLVMPGFLDDTDLRRVVSHASLFVFPSLVEGFGLPTLEAMAAGIPCVVSDREPMASVAGNAAIKVDPLDEHAMAEAISKILNDDALHASLSNIGRKHAGAFTWKKAAKQTLDVYTRLL
jgi:glycosyltransferase involved in cell wall biosynthesis